MKEKEEVEKKEKDEKRKIKERELAMFAATTKNFEPARKKRRTSEEVDDDDDDHQEDGSGVNTDAETGKTNVDKDEEEEALRTGLVTPPRSRSLRSTVTPRSLSKRQETGDVELLNEQEEPVWSPSRETRNTATLADDDDARQLSPLPALTATHTFTIEDDSDSPHVHIPTQTIRPANSRTPSTQQASAAKPPPPPNPILSLLIHSTLPNTTPLLVKRRLNQRLKEVRLAWINKQLTSGVSQDASFPPPDKIILTWRNKRCYDFTSCASLGLVIDELTGEVVVKRKDSDGSSGNVGGPGASGMTVMEEREWRDALAEGGGAQLVLEATTEDIMTRRKNGVEEWSEGAENGNARTGSGVGDILQTSVEVAGYSTTQSQSQTQLQQPKQQGESGGDTSIEPKIKIILRAGKEYEDYKLQVRAVSLVHSTNSPLPHLIEASTILTYSSLVHHSRQNHTCVPQTLRHTTRQNRVPDV